MFNLSNFFSTGVKNSLELKDNAKFSHAGPYILLTEKNAHVTYLDEKWFYTTNRRRKIKKLPRAADEDEGADYYSQPKVRSRRFPIKAMYMGVVGRPIPEKNFDGRVHLERVSQTKTVQKMMAHQNFSDE